jgi:hypothetical protein
MEKSDPPRQEVIGDKRIEEISKSQQVSLGEGAATCQVCGSSFHEGDAVVVYVFRPAGEVMFQVGYVICGDGQHEPPEEFTLGVRELLVEGRVGRCSDVTTQSSWRVLIAPEVRAVSGAATKSAQKISDDGSAANSPSNDEESILSMKISRSEAQRRAAGADADVTRGLFWGDRR